MNKLSIYFNDEIIIRHIVSGVSNYFKITKTVEKYIQDKYPNISTVDSVNDDLESGMYVVRTGNTYTIYKIKTVKDIMGGWFAADPEVHKNVVNKVEEFELVNV